MTAPDSGFPDPRISYQPQPPILDHSYAVLGWLHRASHAVGSDRFAETVDRTTFYLGRFMNHARTPGEKAILSGLLVAIDELITANAQACVVLAESISGMDAAEANEFVKLIESEENPD